MEYKAQYMSAQDVSSGDKLYMVMHLQRVPSAQRWLAVTAVHALDVAESLRNIQKTVWMGTVRTFKVFVNVLYHN